MSDPSSSQEIRQPKRWLLVLLLLPCSVYLGCLAGLAMGALWFRFEAQDLAGIFGVLGGGILGAVAGLAIGGTLSWRASYGLLRRVAFAAAVLAALMVTVDIVWRIADRAKLREQAGLNVPLPPAAGFRIEARIVEPEMQRPPAQLTIDGSTWRATWTRPYPRPGTCTARLSAKEATALLRKRDEIRDNPSRLTSLCSVAEEDATYVYSLRDIEPGAASWKVFADVPCLQNRDEIRELHRLLWSITLDTMVDGRIECKD
jgi:hypothetical protein